MPGRPRSRPRRVPDWEMITRAVTRWEVLRRTSDYQSRVDAWLAPGGGGHLGDGVLQVDPSRQSQYEAKYEADCARFRLRRLLWYETEVSEDDPLAQYLLPPGSALLAGAPVSRPRSPPEEDQDSHPRRSRWGGRRRQANLRRLLNAGPRQIRNGLNYRYVHNLIRLAPDATPEAWGLAWSLGVLEQLAGHLIRLKGQRDTRDARELFCDHLDLVLIGGPHSLGDRGPRFSGKALERFLGAKRSLRSALVALWVAPPDWLARLRRCANLECLTPFFLDRAARAHAKYCRNGCRQAAWRGHPPARSRLLRRGRRARNA